MMMMMPRKTMAHIKTDPAAPATDAAPRASATNFCSKTSKAPFHIKTDPATLAKDATRTLTHEFFDEKAIKFHSLKLSIHSKIRNAWKHLF